MVDAAPNPDMTLQTPFGTFNLRVGFLVFRQGCALLHQDTAQGHWFVPGGRVQFGESTESAVRRELAEEMQAVPQSVEFAGRIENFFVFKGRPFHELLFLYRAAFADDTPIPKADVEGNKIISAWFNQEDLRKTALKPSCLKETYFSFQTGIQHIFHDDRPAAKTRREKERG